MIFEKFNPLRHDVLAVSDLIYDVDYRTFDSLFTSKESAIKAISKRTSNESFDGFQVVLNDEGEIIGILIMYFHKAPSFIQSLKEFSSFRLLLVDILDGLVLCDVKKGDLYIAELAISSKCRGQGLGSEVLKKVLKTASEKGFRRVTLDADFRNEGARKLYEKLGFKIFNKKSFKIGKYERGMYNMEYVL